MTIATNRKKLQFWTNWSLLSMGIITASYIVSLIAVGIVGMGIFGITYDEWGTPLANTLMHMTGGAVIGLGVGLYQKALLKKIFKVTSIWIYTLILGFVITELLTGIVLLQTEFVRGQLRFIEFNPLPESIIVSIAGLLIGFLQWLILRKSFSRSIYWIIASSIGWWLIIFLPYTVGLIDEQASIFAFIPGSFLYGAITGAVLMWVLKPKEINV
ncbi:MAG: hypothetical protein HKP39_08765 [Eudoraea sp.]|nr:hypothetical protein [Eudoraea sp.]